MCNLYRGSSIDASYKVSVHLAKGFQRRRLKCEKLKSSHCLWQGELERKTMMYTTLHKKTTN
jgi:hypothetical protein